MNKIKKFLRKKRKRKRSKMMPIKSCKPNWCFTVITPSLYKIQIEIGSLNIKFIDVLL